MMQTIPHHYSLHPNVYIAPYITTPIIIDGNIEKKEWNPIPFSSPFDDIRGAKDAPPNERPTDACRTRFKMMYDDTYLYIAARIESDMEVVATYTERNSPIYHMDSDFEVFVDPDSSCHYYKELEINALNTVWNLMLDKPYMDGGHEHSGRIAKKGDEKKNNHDYYDVEEQKTATLVVKGELNQTGCNKVIWDVEIALAHSDTLKFQQRHLQGAPKVGDLWRINFSRVERKGNVNWTWQPQRVWKVENHTYCGQVNMHLPDAWGYVRFGPSLSEIKGHAGKAAPAAGQVPNERIVEQGDPFWPLRWTVMNIYYAQRYYYDKNGVYATDMNQLNDLVDKDTLDPFRENMILKASKDCYTIQMFDDNHCYISLNHTRYMKVWKEEEEEGSNIVNMY
jgi:hypothetical protein